MSSKQNIQQLTCSLDPSAKGTKCTLDEDTVRSFQKALPQKTPYNTLSGNGTLYKQAKYDCNKSCTEQQQDTSNRPKDLEEGRNLLWCKESCPK